MRYLKPALVGLVGGLLLAGAVLTVESIRAQRVVASQIANCVAMTAGGGVCSGSAQVGGVEALTGILMCGWSTGFFFAVVSRLHDQTPVAPLARGAGETTRA